MKWTGRCEEKERKCCLYNGFALDNRGQGLSIRVGDSQAYLLRSHQVQPVFPEKKSGALSSFMGMGEDLLVAIEHKEVDLQSGDVLFLLTDGVADSISLPDFRIIWSHCYQDPQLCSTRLVRLAETNGSTDDNSAVTIFYQTR